MKSSVRFGLLGAFTAAAAALGIVGPSKLATPVDAQIPANVNVTKNCATTTINNNGDTTCTVVITNTSGAAITVPAPITVSVTNAVNVAGVANATNGGYGQVLLLNGGSGAAGFDVNNVTVNNALPVVAAPNNNTHSQSIVVSCTTAAALCTLPPGAAGSITVTEAIRGRVGGVVNETIKFGGNTAVSISPSITILPSSPSIAAACTGAVAGTGGGTCQVVLTDTDAFPTWVASGNIQVSILGGNGITINGSTTASFPCANAGQAGPQHCQTITFNYTSSTLGVNGCANLLVNYVSDVPQVDINQTATIANAICVASSGGVGNFVSAASFNVACAVSATATPSTPLTTSPAPGPVGAGASASVVAVGILPTGVQCTITGVTAAGVTPANIIAPGTFEISALNGGLQSASGVLTTNLRIGCDAAAAAVIGGVTNPNTCQGVTFRVFGLGVGLVEVRFRYEPSSIAAAAGIQEREGAFNVGFIAPGVNVNLLLNPNPGIVGGTTTATARFNRTTDCAVATGAATNVCLDPTTGLPQLFNLGSVLNGNVVFTIDNSLIARFTDDVTQNPASAPQQAGFFGSPNQTIRRCGLFPTSGLPSLGALPSTIGGFAFPAGYSLINFFGGCDSVTATLRNLNPGAAIIAATFEPDLPGAAGSPIPFGGNASLGSVLNAGQGLSALLGLNQGAFFFSQQRTLEVVAPAPTGNVSLSRGCNNVSPTVSEAASAYAARVTPAGALVAIWEHQAANNTFRGFSPQAGAPNDLTSVTRLRPVFVCVNAAAQLDQPPA